MIAETWFYLSEKTHFLNFSDEEDDDEDDEAGREEMKDFIADGEDEEPVFAFFLPVCSLQLLHSVNVIMHVYIHIARSS